MVLLKLFLFVLYLVTKKLSVTFCDNFFNYHTKACTSCKSTLINIKLCVIHHINGKVISSELCFLKFKKKTSKYFGVFWNSNNKKWQAQLKHNRKQYYGTLFDNEEHAAMKINLLCDQYGIKRKNSTIDIELHVNPNVIHTLSIIPYTTRQSKY